MMTEKFNEKGLELLANGLSIYVSSIKKIMSGKNFLQM